MNVSKEIMAYLKGNKFDAGFKMRAATPNTPVETRFGIVERMVKGKSVLHIGCVDHMPLIEKKIKANVWMHKRITDCANKCLGIDINREGINLLQEKFQVNNVLYSDILQSLPAQVTGEHWDVAVMGEMLEHVGNPLQMLLAVNKQLGPCADTLLITVPNGFSVVNFKHALKHREFINSDHKFWFSPFTLSKLLAGADMEMREIHYCIQSTIKAYSPIEKWLIKKFPMLRSNIVALAAFTNAT